MEELGKHRIAGGRGKVFPAPKRYVQCSKQLFQIRQLGQDALAEPKLCKANIPDARERNDAGACSPLPCRCDRCCDDRGRFQFQNRVIPFRDCGENMNEKKQLEDFLLRK